MAGEPNGGDTSQNYNPVNQKNRRSGRSNNFKGMGGVVTVPVTDDVAADMAWAFQSSATKHLQKRLSRAIDCIQDYEKRYGDHNIGVKAIQDVVVCGGVASNKYLRHALSKTVESHGWVLQSLPLLMKYLQICQSVRILLLWFSLADYDRDSHTHRCA